jgi:sporulation protein YlmC with PRC-barrel domain
MRNQGRHPVLVKLSDAGQTMAKADEDIRGRAGQDRYGADLGRVDDLLIDSAQGKVRMLRIERGGILGFGAKASFVPVESIVRITGETVHIDQTRERVAAAPTYDPDVIALPAAYGPVYGYYAYPPFREGLVTARRCQPPLRSPRRRRHGRRPPGSASLLPPGASARASCAADPVSP